MANSPNLGLPYISAAQAQKHVTHNEALASLDTIVQLTVASASETTPPTGAPLGARYVIPSGATGPWSGATDRLAQQDVGGWRLVEPSVGLRAWVIDQSTLAIFDGSGWVDIRSFLGSFTQLGINTTADTTNRLALASPASLFNHEGGSHRMVINKQSISETASMVFQNGFSGRAEFGLTGTDDFSVKVSDDGATWLDSLRCDRASGRVAMPAGLTSPGLPLRVETAVLTAGFTTTATSPQKTGLLVTITPQSAASKMLVRGHLTVGGYLWNSAAAAITVERNGLKVWPAASGVSMTNLIMSGNLANSRQTTFPATFEFLDAPATTAPVTYEVMVATTNPGLNAHLNVRDSDLAIRGESSLVVTEISG